MSGLGKMGLFKNGLAKTGLMAMVTVLALMAGVSVSAKPDPNKVLRFVFPAAETGFDPAVSQDLYSSQINHSIFESLYTYDYMARPAKIVPQAADGLPEVSANGKTYTIRLKKGIYFSPDPAFGGKQRELTMDDFVYSYKRLFDPRIRSPHSWLFEGKIVGLDEYAALASKQKRFDYDVKIPGFEVIDKYTLRLHLKQTDYHMTMMLAHNPAVALAREVVEKYQDAQGHVMAHPVGTGAYRLVEWVRASRIVLEANPQYRGYTWNFAAGTDPEDADIVAKMKGKSMPQIGRIEVSVMLEDQSRLLAFQNAEVDLFELQGPLAPKMLEKKGTIRAEFASKGYQISRVLDPEISYYYWNLEDPVVGGFGKEKIALRRALAMAYNVPEEIAVVWNGHAEPVQFPIPPGVVGHDPQYKSTLQFDPAVANALLDKFGYKKGADGFRTLPDGKPLVVNYVARNDSAGQHQAEMWKKAYDLVAVQMVTHKKPFPDILKGEKACQVQTRTSPWVADYPDGDNFMMLFTKANIHQANNSCFSHPDYDKMYLQSQAMPAGPERDVLFHKMARILELYGGVRIGYARYRNMVAQPKVIGFKKHPIFHTDWLYIDIDNSKK